MASKSKDATTTAGPGPDISLLRSPIQISGKPIEQVLKSVHYGSPELRCLLLDECDLIFECKVCRALFRDVPNFISHKRVYCTKSSLEDRHVTIANLPDEKVVVIQPQAPEEDQPSEPLASKQKNARPSLSDTIQRIQSGELGKSEAYKVYTEAADKLQKQKEAMKIATIRTTPIPTNKNAVFIEVNTTSVNIHERQQQQNALTTLTPGNDSGKSDALGPARNKRMTGSSPASSPKHFRKPNRQQKHTTEPQKLLLEQLKEIQHKVKQKSQESIEKVVKLKITSQENSVPAAKKKTKASNCNDENENSKETSESSSNVKDKLQSKDNEDLSVLARQNFLSLLAKEETKAGVEKEKAEGKQSVVIPHRKNTKVWQDVSKQSATEAAKLLVKNLSKDRKRGNSLTCVKCSSIFSSTRSLGFHMKIHHSPKRTVYQCPYCPSNFYYFFGITRHLLNNHAKTAQEVDAMRAQLRDKAVVMPAPPPKTKKDIFEIQSSRTRLAKQKIDGEDGEDPTSRRRGKSNKPEEINSLEKQQANEKTKVHNKEPGAETIVLNDSSDSDDDSTSGAQTNINKSFLNASNESKVTRSCSKCNRTFRRQGNYEKHIKICQNNKSSSGDSNDKPLTSAVNQVKEIAEDADPKLLARKNKLLNSTFGLTRVDAQSVITKSKGIGTSNTASSQVLNVAGSQILKEMLLAAPFEEKIHARDLSDESLESCSLNNGTKRSVSAERDVSRLSRNPKSDVEKSKRDSSAESVQSNNEGRPARARRTVPSKYAVIPTLVPKSQLKSESEKGEDVGSAKSSPENLMPLLPKLQKRPENRDENITVVQQVIFPLPKLQKRPDVDDSEAKQIIKVPLPKLLKMPYGEDSTAASEANILEDSSSPEVETKTNADNDSSIDFTKKLDLQEMLLVQKKDYKSEMKRKQGLPQKTYFSPRFPIGSGLSPFTTPTLSTSKHLHIQRISSPTRRRNSLSSGKRRSISSVNSVQKRNRNNASLESAQSPGPPPLVASSVTPITSRGDVQPLLKEISDVGSAKKEELEALSLSSGNRVSGRGTKASPALPISALSERPKRKRKVPSKNLDAHEMLAKIHNRESDIPSKRARLSETKPRGDKSVEMKQAPPFDKASTSGINKSKEDKSGSDSEDEDSVDAVKGKGRVVSNRIYVLNERKSKVQKLKCYDLTRVGKYIDLETMSCLQCGESCASISNLRRHVIRQHLKWSRFKCKLCKFESYDRSECTTHLFRTHNKMASRSFTSRRSLNTLIIDLVKQGLQARNLKKTKTLQGKQQESQREGNIYIRPNVRKVPRLPERAAVTALSNGKNTQPQTPLMEEDSRSSQKSAGSNSPINSSDASLKISPPADAKKLLTESKSVRTSRKSDTSTPGTKKEMWFKVTPTGKLKKIMPFNISTRNSPRNFDTSPYKQGFIAKNTRSEELVLQTRKGKYTKLNRSPASSSSVKRVSETKAVPPSESPASNSSVKRVSETKAVPPSESPASNSSVKRVSETKAVPPSESPTSNLSVKRVSETKSVPSSESPAPSSSVKRVSETKSVPPSESPASNSSVKRVSETKSVPPSESPASNSSVKRVSETKSVPPRESLASSSSVKRVSETKSLPPSESSSANSSIKRVGETKSVPAKFDDTLSPSDARQIIDKKSLTPVKQIYLRKGKTSEDVHDDKVVKGNSSLDTDSGTSSKTVMPVVIKGQSATGDITPSPTSQKGSVKYIITTAGSSRIVDKSPMTQNVIVNPVIHKMKDTTESSPAVSEQLAKSLMKLKKLGDSMGNSSATPKSTPTTSAAPSGSSCSSSTQVASNSMTNSAQKVPVSLIGKTEMSKGKAQSSTLSIPLSIPSGNSPSSIVLTRGSSGKIIVYTHSTESSPHTSYSSNNVPLKTILPSSLSAPKISGNKPGGRITKPEEDSLPSGTFVIEHHFL
ncbi:microtubule-associated protein futsch [Biomphalaria pfeifferi]|uniref:Microtubule-associated protein futsch n=1 Tax=Biomphalaria pfeifferi TaxID=112525 RepID=A0AAD8EYQ4_BIOPF|nr:microtubule-associated protein futsch [Biomphalaria pfeifferi]